MLSRSIRRRSASVIRNYLEGANGAARYKQMQALGPNPLLLLSRSAQGCTALRQPPKASAPPPTASRVTLSLAREFLLAVPMWHRNRAPPPPSPCVVALGQTRCCRASSVGFGRSNTTASAWRPGACRRAHSPQRSPQRAARRRPPPGCCVSRPSWPGRWDWDR